MKFFCKNTKTESEVWLTNIDDGKDYQKMNFCDNTIVYHKLGGANMRTTAKTTLGNESICVSREVLPQLLGCGQATADRISREAGARIKVGKRIIIKLDKLNAYLDTVAE